MRLVLLGSGAFALPTFGHLSTNHDVSLVVSQPDRPAGRRRTSTPTPVAEWAEASDLPLLRAADINSPNIMNDIRGHQADAWVVIAFGQKLSEALLHDQFAINLHGSLLPRWRGASPIHHAILAGDESSGVSVITLASAMDGGDVLGSRAMPIGPDTTTGELHDALSLLGPEVVSDVLDAFQHNTLQPTPQNAQEVTHAPKLSRHDICLDLSEAGQAVRTINGLSPWPGVDAVIGDQRVRLVSAKPSQASGTPGMVTPDGLVGCLSGTFQLVQVQPPGKRAMPFQEWAHGRRWSQPVKIETHEAGS